MKNLWKKPAARITFSLIIIICTFLSLVQSSSPVHAQVPSATPVLHNPGTITTSITGGSAAPAASTRIAGISTSMPPAINPTATAAPQKGKITTSLSPATNKAAATAAPSKGTITTSTGPAVQKSVGINAAAPSFQVSASCSPDANGLMTITNTGGDMTTPFTWRLSLNGIPVAQNTFQLTAGQTFNVSTSGLYGTLTMDVLDAANTVVATGSMFCLSPTATPTVAPPAFQVSASCSPDANGVMTITNTGGNMPTPFTWRLSLNGIPVAQNTFQISPGQTFNISTSGLYGTLTMDVLDAANNVVATGSMFCLSPTATPTVAPPAFQVSASCAPDSNGLMTITNTGGNMTTPFTWRISLNGTPIAQNTFLISPGQTFNINVSGLYGTLTLDVLDAANTVVATGSMFCLSPTATPTLAPPAFQVSASCAPDSNGLMTITNTGGNMTTPFTWRISLNGTPIAQNTFLISPGQTFNINTSGLYGTLVLDVLDPANTVVATGSMFCLSPSATPTITPVNSLTPTPSPTDTSTSTPLPTDTFTPTATFTPSPTWTFTPSPTATRVPVAPRVTASYPYNNSRLEKGPSRITIFFSQDVIHDGSSNAANNIANYLLVENGHNNTFDTTSCQAGRSGDDVAMTIASVVYNRVMERSHVSFVATIKLNHSLPSGHYRLFVCGSTSIENLAGVKLNNGVDSVISFNVAREDH